MCLKNQKISLKDLVDFIPPKRFDSPKCSYIGFYQRNPNTGKLQRCKIMLNKYEPGLQRDNMAAAIMASIMNVLDLQPNDAFVIEDLFDDASSISGLNVTHSNNNVIVNNDTKVLRVQNEMLERLLASKEETINILTQRIEELKRTYDNFVQSQLGQNRDENLSN